MLKNVIELLKNRLLYYALHWKLSKLAEFLNYSMLIVIVIIEKRSPEAVKGTIPPTPQKFFELDLDIFSYFSEHLIVGKLYSWKYITAGVFPRCDVFYYVSSEILDSINSLIVKIQNRWIILFKMNYKLELKLSRVTSHQNIWKSEKLIPNCYNFGWAFWHKTSWFSGKT